MKLTIDQTVLNISQFQGANVESTFAITTAVLSILTYLVALLLLILVAKWTAVKKGLLRYKTALRMLTLRGQEQEAEAEPARVERDAQGKIWLAGLLGGKSGFQILQGRKKSECSVPEESRKRGKNVAEDVAGETA